MSTHPPRVPAPLIGVTGQWETLVIEEGPYLALTVDADYTDLVEGAGGIPFVIASHEAGAEAVLDRLDGLLVTGGADLDPEVYGHERHPLTDPPERERDALELALVRGAMRRGMPVLGICRGNQLIAAALGGTLHQHVDGHAVADRPSDAVHDVEVVAGSRLAAVLGAGRLGVNSLHHQAVADPGPELVVCARLAGDDLIEGVEHPTAPVLGVQWHPERQSDRSIPHRLFGWLLEQSAQYATSHRQH